MTIRERWRGLPLFGDNREVAAVFVGARSARRQGRIGYRPGVRPGPLAVGDIRGQYCGRVPLGYFYHPTPERLPISSYRNLYSVPDCVVA